MAATIRSVVPVSPVPAGPPSDQPEMTVGAAPGSLRPIPRDLQAAGVAAGPTAEQLAEGRARRQQIHAAAAPPPVDEGAAENPLDPPEPEVAVEPREQYESVDIELPNGRVITYGPVRGASKALVIARIVGVQATALLAPQVIEILVNIRAVDGIARKTIENMVQAQLLLNEIDDDGYEHLLLAHNTYWPPARVDTLKVLQRRLR